jgi:hypothetical protein
MGFVAAGAIAGQLGILGTQVKARQRPIEAGLSLGAMQYILRKYPAKGLKLPIS